MADNNTPLINKYRPVSFDEVLGHDDIVAALKRALDAPTRPHAFLLTGPSGVGKTTLARIIAASLQAEIIEIDAASNSGIADVRNFIELGQYQSLYGSDAKMLIVDECHGLSRPAWEALLKTLEEPPDHLYIALCTTEMHRVKDTIQTRCYHIPLKPIKDTDIEELLLLVSEMENWTVNNDVLSLIIQGATGQPRKALSLLQACYYLTSRDEAKRVISLLDESEPLIDLLRYLIEGKKSWKVIKGLIVQIESTDFEEAKIGAGRYITNAMLNTENETQAASMWQLLEALLFPAATFDPRTAFIAAIGRILWSS